MGKLLNKLTNANYSHNEQPRRLTVNEKTRHYIDRFVSENYGRLSAKFAALDYHVNSSCFSSMDKLNETICSLYTDPKLCFFDWDEAKVFLKNKFTEKAMRVPLKKAKESEVDNENEEGNEQY